MKSLTTALVGHSIPFGGKDTIAPAVQDLADDVVPWDQRQLVDAIKRQARHEETTRFDVIEFKLD